MLAKERRPATTAKEMDALLARILQTTSVPSQRLKSAMHYALIGGKHVRPFLLIESAALFRVPRKRALQTGAALACIHAYSLIHDDLPAVDNAKTRRDKPSVHKKFDEATAILAGDALLTLAFELLASPSVHTDANVRAELMTQLSRAAGASGMIAGQMLDLQLEGRWGKMKLSMKNIRTMESLKTAQLFSFACEAGAILGKANKKDRATLANFGLLLGEAYQIADDLRDIKEDKKLGKLTSVTFAGEKQACARLKQLVSDAKKIMPSSLSELFILFPDL